MSIVSSTGVILTQATAVSSTAFPVTFAAWVFVTSIPVTAPIIQLIGASGNAGIYTKGTSNLLECYSALGGSNAEADSSVGIAFNVWKHVVGIITSAASRVCYLNAGNSGSNATSINPGTMTTTSCCYFTGKLAYPAIWNVALTTNDISNLYNAGAGSDPRYTQPANLVSFSPFLNSSYLDVVTGQTWSVAGSPTFSTDPFALSNWPANPPLFF